MIIFEKAVPKNFNLWCLADFHIGTVAFAEEKFLKMLADIEKDPMARVVGLGDYVEGRAVDHPYFEFDTTDLNTPIAFKQAEVVVGHLKRIKKKILVLGEGNHDRYSRNYIGLTGWICKELGVDFGTWSYVVRFKTPKGSFNGFFTHGSDKRSPVNSSSEISIRRKLNEKLSLIRILSATGISNTLINCCAHYHRMIVYHPRESEDLMMVAKGSTLKQMMKQPSHDGDFIPVFERFFSCTGSWMKQYVEGISTYGERAGYPPSNLGAVVYEVRDGKPVDVVRRAY